MVRLETVTYAEMNAVHTVEIMATLGFLTPFRQRSNRRDSTDNQENTKNLTQ